jgi:uncharacterized membrane protein YfcA
VVRFVLLLLAGVGAGLTGSVAGLASLVSYPAVLAAGLGPVTANVTNTVALVCSSVGSVAGSRPELTGQGRRLRRLAVAGALGGIVGAALLLVTPAESFERIVPFLIAGASVAILVRRRLVDAVEHEPGAHDGRATTIGVGVVGIYGGYFGAGAGVMLLALLLWATTEPLPRANAAKNLVLGVANGIAALAFVVLGDVRWSVVVPLGLGLLVGGRLGPVVVRRSNAAWLRAAIAVAGMGLAIKLGIDAYS